MELKNLLPVVISLLLVLPLISAYNGWGGFGYYRSPLEYLDNEWVMFSIIILVFFAIVYYTVNKAFDNNVVSGVIALSVSLLIAITVLRRGYYLYGYAGDELGSWILVATVLIAIGFLIKFAYEGFGVVGSTATVIVVWLLLQRANLYEILPYGAPPALLNVLEFFASILGLIVLIILAIAFAPFLEKKSPFERGAKKLFKKLGVD